MVPVDIADVHVDGQVDILAYVSADGPADIPDLIASYEEFQPFDIWTSQGGIPHTYLIHHNISAHGEPPRRRPGNHPLDHAR